MSQPDIYRRVVAHTWYSAKSLIHLTNARWWQLELECGHVERRRFRYRNETAELGSAYGFDQALPPPKRVICKQCAWGASDHCSNRK